MIRKATLADTSALLEIYNYYVIHTTVTFDESALSLSAFTEKLELILKDYPCIVFEDNNEILGFAYGSKFRPKPAYNYTVESTVYVKNGAHGKQIGSKLYTELLEQLKQRNFKSVLGVLTIPNPASVKLHEKFGFTQVAHLKEVGFKFDTWLDVGIFQLKIN
ncbi:GNAT family N-acetyltransferase [Algibacter lectus]|uniref:Phosphinothricin N-acetyltransferase n=1 Tax=Algibacter lectus TaxID=221126 RepID=A0A090WMQ9_9FLAO|nr:GNAT family N-acetyltransferase [Algibacter lectus]MWW25598.1 GNAT family N-acetyltransferase [Algibacter lectus]TDY61545.1 phosphinothricin acetyltransferase [Algibacter lectus]GAL78286.1 phosphinothricin N-acetyltransferase [Algibacter lectus]SFD13345.1 phosphinothricin acetyltransferase [Algibacter lectus]